MSIPRQDLNNLLRYNVKIKKGKQKNKNRGGKAPAQPKAPKFNPYRYVKSINTNPSKYQAPHYGEVVDLTDDLAPEMSNTGNTVQPGMANPHPVAGRSDNKLNFKLQKTKPKSTPDLTKYQNHFKLLSRASPDSEHEDQTEEKAEAQPQTASVDQTDQGNTDDAYSGLPQSVMEIVKAKLKELPAGKKPIIMPKVEDLVTVQPQQANPVVVTKSPFADDLQVSAQAKASKAPDTKAEAKVDATPVATPIKGLKLRPIEVLFPRNKMATPAPNMLDRSKPSPGDNVKKDAQKKTQQEKKTVEPPKRVTPKAPMQNPGIRSSTQQGQERKTVDRTSRFKPQPQNLVYDYPKGIPKSFLKKEDLEKYRVNVTQPAIPSLLSIVTDYPAGIPKSFLKQQDYNIRHNNVDTSNPQQHSTTPLQNTIPDYQLATSVDLPSWILGSQSNPEPVERPSSIYDDLDGDGGPTSPTFAQHEPKPNRAYSPSELYVESAGNAEEDAREGSESPDMLQPGQKRLSAFQRLGPLTKPKKPKLTINLMFNKEQSVREVVDGSADSFRFLPVHLRRDVLQSEDEIVKKYLPFWPWKKNFVVRKSVSVRHSKSVMILEQEQMEAAYEKDNMFIHVSVKGYPITWTKEDVLDAILECVKGRTFIPCFIEFTPQECKFLVIRSRAALIILHKVGFCVRAANTELTVTISLTETSLNQLDFIPRLVLRRRFFTNQKDSSLDVSNFLLGSDVSHFIYFPLNRVTNQVELFQLHSSVAWEFLTELNLSRNRLTTLDGFNLQSTTPKLRHLDLSHNLLDKVTILLKCRELPLRSIKLEGNPLCLDYIDSAHYVKVVRMIFSGLREIDGVPITFKGDFPPSKRNYCPEAASGIVEKFLETFFPLLEAPCDDRAAIENMYEEDAVMTITFRSKLRYGTAFRYFRNLFVRSRDLQEGDMEAVRGAPAIGDLITKWPPIEHDRYTIAVDVMHHDESTTILRIGGVLKLTAESLAEDEHLLTFSRTVVLHTRNGAEYKIHNEMLYWDVPCKELAMTAFNITTVRPKQLSSKLDSPPDEELKSKLLSIFVGLADIDKKRGERCLERKNWDLRSALEYYVKLLKLDDLSLLNEPEKETTPVSVPQPS